MDCVDAGAGGRATSSIAQPSIFGDMPTRMPAPGLSMTSAGCEAVDFMRKTTPPPSGPPLEAVPYTLPSRDWISAASGCAPSASPLNSERTWNAPSSVIRKIVPASNAPPFDVTP